MGILSRKNKDSIVTGAVDTVRKVVDLIDKRKYTDQEKAGDSVQFIAAANQFIKDTLGESTERSITRRWIAIIYMCFYCVLVLVLVFAWKFDPLWAEFILEAMEGLWLAQAFMAVIIFFFGAQILRYIKG